MFIITFGGQVGAGGPEIGRATAVRTDARYVQHLALRRIARKLGASVPAVVQKELNFSSRWARILSFLELAFERMGAHGYHAAGPHLLPVLSPEKPGLRSLPAEIPDSEYLEAVYCVSREFASEGGIVLVKRAGCVTLKGVGHAVHVGLFAASHVRIARMAWRLGVGRVEAEEAVKALEKARRAWFHRLGAPSPEDMSHYDLAIHTDLGETDAQVAGRILDAAREINPALAVA
jgi:cytidylate kinase